jgi:endoglucanase
MNIKSLIKELCQIPAPSGFEQMAADRIAEILKPLVDDIWSDAMGNVIGVKRCGLENAPKLLLDAHMDEIGFIVTEICGGFLKFSSIGKYDPRLLPGREVCIMAEKPLYGVIGCLPPHILSEEEKEKAIEIKNLYIDTGLSEENLKKLVPVGTPGVFAGEYFELGEENIVSKALDDRLCVGVLLKVMENIRDAKLAFDVYFMASTQEEVGMRGSAPGAFGVEPDYCIAVDVTFAQQPDTQKSETFKAGGGVTLGIGPNASRGITQKLAETAKRHNIPYSMEVMPGSSGTNAWPVQVICQGVATAIVSVPVKYMHSPIETVKLTDAEAACALITEYINGGSLTC